MSATQLFSHSRHTTAIACFLKLTLAFLAGGAASAAAAACAAGLFTIVPPLLSVFCTMSGLTMPCTRMNPSLDMAAKCAETTAVSLLLCAIMCLSVGTYRMPQVYATDKTHRCPSCFIGLHPVPCLCSTALQTCMDVHAYTNSSQVNSIFAGSVQCKTAEVNAQ